MRTMWRNSSLNSPNNGGVSRIQPIQPKPSLEIWMNWMNLLAKFQWLAAKQSNKRNEKATKKDFFVCSVASYVVTICYHPRIHEATMTSLSCLASPRSMRITHGLTGKVRSILTVSKMAGKQNEYQTEHLWDVNVSVGRYVEMCICIIIYT